MRDALFFLLLLLLYLSAIACADDSSLRFLMLGESRVSCFRGTHPPLLSYDFILINPSLLSLISSVHQGIGVSLDTTSNRLPKLWGPTPPHTHKILCCYSATISTRLAYKAHQTRSGAACLRRSTSATHHYKYRSTPCLATMTGGTVGQADLPKCSTAHCHHTGRCPH